MNTKQAEAKAAPFKASAPPPGASEAEEMLLVRLYQLSKLTDAMQLVERQWDEIIVETEEQALIRSAIGGLTSAISDEADAAVALAHLALDKKLG